MWQVSFLFVKNEEEHVFEEEHQVIPFSENNESMCNISLTKIICGIA